MGFGVRSLGVSILAGMLAVSLVPAAQANDSDPAVKSYWLHMNSTSTSDEMINTEARRRSVNIVGARTFEVMIPLDQLREDRDA